MEEKTMKEFVLKSERVKKLRESALSKFPGVSVERGRLLTKAYKEHEGKSKYIVRAYAVKEILENMTIYIKDGELVVGNQSVDERTAPLFPEYAVDWIIDEIKTKGNFDHRDGDKFRIPEEEIPELLEICEWWRGKTLKDKAHAQMPQEIKEAGIVSNLVEHVRGALLYCITIVLGMTVGATANAETFLSFKTINIIILGFNFFTLLEISSIHLFPVF